MRSLTVYYDGAVKMAFTLVPSGTALLTMTNYIGRWVFVTILKTSSSMYNGNVRVTSQPATVMFLDNDISTKSTAWTV